MPQDKGYVAPQDTVHKTTTWQGLDINIERPKGFVRTWVYKDNRKPFTVKYKHDYGSIPGVKDYDDEDLDVMLGPLKNAKKVYVIEKAKSSHTKETRKQFDEHKVFLGFKNLDAVKKIAPYYFGKAVQRIYPLAVPDFKEMLAKGKMEKRSHIFITGLPGAGKTTEAKRLSEELKMPLISLDGIPKGPNKAWTSTAQARAFIKKNLDEPHIVEGAQILGFKPRDLRGHKVIYMDQPRDVLIDRIVQRGMRTQSGKQLRGEADRAEITKSHEMIAPTGKAFLKRNKDFIDQIKHACDKVLHKIPGGLAEKEDKAPSDFDSKAIAQGVKVEKEHTSDTAIATEITTDHLTEDKNYYLKLKKMESKDKTGSVLSLPTDNARDFAQQRRSRKRRKPVTLGQPAAFFTDPDLNTVKQAYDYGVRMALYAVNLIR